MKRFIVLVAAGALLAPAGAEVTIVRRLPATGETIGQAQWTAPRPEAGRALERPRISGRLSTGALGGQDIAGDALYGFSTDSQITVVQPLRGASALRLDGAALRKSVVDGTNQAYSGKLGIIGEKMSADIEGGYRQNDRTVQGESLTDIDATIRASFTALPVATLPVKLAYQSTWADRDDATTSDRQSHNVQLAAVGTLGKLGTELTWALNQATEPDNETESFSTSGRFFVSVPLASFVALRAGVAPGYTDTTYAATDNETRTTSLLSSVGLVFPIAEGIETYVAGGLLNSWRRQEGPSAVEDSDDLAVQGEIGANIRDWAGFSATPRYEIARTIDGGLSHVATANASWQTEEPVVLQRAEAGGQLTYSTTEGGSVLLDEKKWNLSLTAVPALAMNLNGGYQGSFRREPPSEIWNQQATLSFTHDPHPLLSYKAGFALSDFAANTDYDLFKYETSGAVYLKPRWGDRVGTFGLLETFSVADGEADTERISKASALMAVPVTRTARLGYQLDWEWVDPTEPDGDDGNMLRHEGNVSFAGRRLPFSTSVRYSFAHGYRGPRHDAAAQLVVPFAKGFEGRGTFNFAHYEQDDETLVPFVLELEVSRVF